jgi:hypothetical protein
MMNIFKSLKKKSILWLFACLVISVFVWWFSFSKADDDLLWQLIEPAYNEEVIIWLWKSKELVWKTVFKWTTKAELWIGVRVPQTNGWKPVCRVECSEACSEITEFNEGMCKRQWKYEWNLELSAWLWKEPSLIVKVTRMLLILTITLSITMILYNWMMYIIQTWQWKEWKSVTKNIAYIIAWILIALFSVIIIKIIQSITTTIADPYELPMYGYEQDKAVISQSDKWVGVKWRVF